MYVSAFVSVFICVCVFASFCLRACVRVIGVRLGVCLCTARLKKDTRSIRDSSGSKTKLLSDYTRHICDPGLCHNHGSCINVTGVAECKCQESYAGQYCDGGCFKGPPSIRRYSTVKHLAIHTFSCYVLKIISIILTNSSHFVCFSEDVCRSSSSSLFRRHSVS